MEMEKYNYSRRFLLGVSWYLLISIVNGLHPNVGLDEYQIMTKYGYSYEKYDVTSEDGYILEMIRVLPRIDGDNISNSIPYKIYPNLKTDTPRQPVLLMHGIIASARDFMSHDPDKAITFALVNHGYDVFVGNARGSTRSRRHVTLNPDEDPEQFWDFSWHELGVYDLPAMIDYILMLTKFTKLVYIGHSQGGTSFYAMCSMRPEMNDKVKIALNMAAPAIMKYAPNTLLRNVASFVKDLQELAKRVQIYEILRYSPVFLDLIKIISDGQFGLNNILIQIVGPLQIINFQNVDMALMPVIATSYPSGCSMNQVIHYLQNIQTGQFRLFDYNDKDKNLKKYGSIEPPKYNLSAITCKTVLYYSQGDLFIQSKDILMVAKAMKNAIPIKIKVPFSHADYIWSKNINNYILRDILWRIKNA